MKNLAWLAAILVMVWVPFISQGEEPIPQDSLTPTQAAQALKSESPPPLLKAQDQAVLRVAHPEPAVSPASEPAEAPKSRDAGTLPAVQADQDPVELWLDVLVIDSRRQPVPGANLTLETVSGNSPGALLFHFKSQRHLQTTTDDAGQARLDVKRLDLLRVTVDAIGFAPAASQTFRLTRTSPHASVEIQIGTGGSVVGQLQDIHGSPANDIRISIHLSAWPGQVGRRSTRVMQQISTDEQGSFLFARLTPGDYNLYTHAADKDLARVPAQTLKLRVIDGETTQVKFEDLTQTYVQLRGKLLCNDRPVPFARISITWADSARGHINKNANANEAGEFQITLDEGGEYRFNISSDNLQGSYLPTISIPSEPSHEIEIRFSTGEISGRVLDSGGKPVPDFNLMAIGKNEVGRGIAFAVTNQPGEYNFSDLVAGTYSVMSANSMPTLEPESHTERPYLGSARIRKLDVLPGQTLMDVDLQFSSASAIAASVIDSDGNPVKGAGIQFKRSGPRIPGTRSIMPSSELSDAQGLYLGGGLAEGKYLVAATLGHQPSQSILVDAQLNTTATVQLVLEDGAMISSTALVEGEPGTTCFVRLFNTDGLVVATGYSREGRCELGPVVPGAYTIHGRSTSSEGRLKDEQALIITGSGPVSIELNMK